MLEKNDKSRSVLIVEDDGYITSFIDDALKHSGGYDTRIFHDGHQAWEEARNNTYDLVILDWKVPSLNGLCLFNRIRQLDSYQKVPILVISGFLRNKDFKLLDEFLYSTTLEKPFNAISLQRAIRSLVKEVEWVDQNEKKIEKLFAKLNSDSGAYLDTIFKLEGKSPSPVKLCLSAAKILRKKRLFKEAEVVLQKAITKRDHSLMALTELSKLYLETGQNDKAELILKKAMDLSPKNIDRICKLGDLNLENQNPEVAADFYNQALDIDESNEVAQSGVKLAGNIQGWLDTHESPPKTYAGLLNAIGVSMVRKKQFSKGIDHYKSALQHIFQPEVKARLNFNLGLAYRKWSKPKEAIPWFKKSLSEDPHFDRAIEQLNVLKVPVPTNSIGEEEKQSESQEVDEQIILTRDDAPESNIERANEVGLDELDSEWEDFDSNLDSGIDFDFKDDDIAELISDGADGDDVELQEGPRISQSSKKASLADLKSYQTENKQISEADKKTKVISLNKNLKFNDNRRFLDADCYNWSDSYIDIGVNHSIGVGRKLLLIDGVIGVLLKVSEHIKPYKGTARLYFYRVVSVDQQGDLAEMIEKIEP